MLSFVGSTGSTTISFILPGLFFTKLFKDDTKERLLVGLARCLTLYGCCIFVFWYVARLAMPTNADRAFLVLVSISTRLGGTQYRADNIIVFFLCNAGAALEGCNVGLCFQRYLKSVAPTLKQTAPGGSASILFQWFDRAGIETGSVCAVYLLNLHPSS